jgi:hypothetical protein
LDKKLLGKCNFKICSVSSFNSRRGAQYENAWNYAMKLTLNIEHSGNTIDTVRSIGVALQSLGITFVHYTVLPTKKTGKFTDQTGKTVGGWELISAPKYQEPEEI